MHTQVSFSNGYVQPIIALMKGDEVLVNECTGMTVDFPSIGRDDDVGLVYPRESVWSWTEPDTRPPEEKAKSEREGAPEWVGKSIRFALTVDHRIKYFDWGARGGPVAKAVLAIAGTNAHYMIQAVNTSLTLTGFGDAKPFEATGTANLEGAFMPFRTEFV